jgi:hypothetical protein
LKLKLASWLTLSLTLGAVVDAIAHRAYVAAFFLVLALRLAVEKVLRAHSLWGEG